MKLIIQDSKFKQRQIEINDNANVKDLYEAIKNKLGINKDMLLIYDGETLDLAQNEKLSYYDIVNNSLITYIGKFQAGTLN